MEVTTESLLCQSSIDNVSSLNVWESNSSKAFVSKLNTKVIIGLKEAMVDPVKIDIVSNHTYNKVAMVYGNGAW